MRIFKIFSVSRLFRFLIEDVLLFYVKLKLSKKLREGYNYHQNEVKKDKKLYDYVLKENFIDD